MFNKKIIKTVLLAFTISIVFVGCKETGKKKNETGNVVVDNYEIVGYITEFDMEKNKLKINEVEWISFNDPERIKELGLNTDTDMPSGFYINEINEKEKEFSIESGTEYEIVQNAEGQSIDVNAFSEYAVANKGNLFRMRIDKDIVKTVKEQYIP